MEVICLSESYRNGLKIEQILFISTNVAQSNYENDKWMFLRKIVQQYPWRVTLLLLLLLLLIVWRNNVCN